MTARNEKLNKKKCVIRKKKNGWHHQQRQVSLLFMPLRIWSSRFTSRVISSSPFFVNLNFQNSSVDWQMICQNILVNFKFPSISRNDKYLKWRFENVKCAINRLCDLQPPMAILRSVYTYSRKSCKIVK